MGELTNDPWWAGGPADLSALLFLRDNGPHTMGAINDEGAVAAALVFIGLEHKGLVSRSDFGGGHVQYAITPAGRAALEAEKTGGEL